MYKADIDRIRTDIIKKGTVINLMLQLIFGCVVALKGDFDTYMSSFLIVFSVCEAVFIYGWVQGANKRLVWSVIILINIGSCIQNVLGQMHSGEAAMIIFTSLIITIIYAVLDKKYIIDKKFMLYFLASFGIIISLLLIVFGKSINGTKAWLVIGNISLQLSDFVKMTFLYFTAVLYSSDYDEMYKFKLSSVFFIIISALLMLMNELGTILVIFSVYITFIVIYIRNKRCRYMVFCMVAAGILMIAAMYNFTSEAMSVDENFAASKIGSIFAKVTNRIRVWINYDGSKYEAYGYQALKAKQAALIGGWFGNSQYTIDIPVAASDFVFPAILMKFGLVTGLAVILLFFNIYYRINYTTSPLKIASITSLCFQAFIMIAGSINFFVMTGLGIPFLSSGGTSTLITYILVYNILSRSDFTYEK